MVPVKLSATTVRGVLEKLAKGEVSVDEAERALRLFSLQEVGELAKLDLQRGLRRGAPEVVLAEGKSVEDLLKVVEGFVAGAGRAVISRVSEGQLRALEARFRGRLRVYRRARMAVVMAPGFKVGKTGGKVGVLAAGTADVPVAEEAVVMARQMGCEVFAAYDVGVAGVHRLFGPLRRMVEKGVSAIVVAAGTEGALPSVVAGLVDVPVIGVPVSRGYGLGGGGVGALVSMLQSCSLGVATVNIDNGVGAGVLAAMIANKVAEARRHLGHRKYFKSTLRGGAMAAFCVKCRKKVTVSGAETKTLKSGRKALVGKCPHCGTKVFKFVKG